MQMLEIPKQYPPQKFNLLGNTNVIVKIPDIMKPVIQAVKINPDPDKGEVYKRDGKLAITKNGLGRLADGAGITQINTESVLPSSCKKCAEVNRNVGKPIQCGTCPNQDIAFRVTISVPQLTGVPLIVADTNEIIVENVTAGMTQKQKNEFLKFMPQICEAKALNGAIRTALHIKGAYTREELEKPFVVAYLVPNMDNQTVRSAAIEQMFQSSKSLFGSSPETKAPEIVQAEPVPQIEAAQVNEEEQAIIDSYVDAPAVEMAADPEPMEERERNDWYCDKCGVQIARNVWDYSVQHFERPLCYKCQKEERRTR